MNLKRHHGFKKIMSSKNIRKFEKVCEIGKLFISWGFSDFCEMLFFCPRFSVIHTFYMDGQDIEYHGCYEPRCNNQP